MTRRLMGNGVTAQQLLTYAQDGGQFPSLPLYHFDRRVGGPHSRSGLSGEEKDFALPGIEPRLSSPYSPSLSRLPHNICKYVNLVRLCKKNIFITLVNQAMFRILSFRNIAIGLSSSYTLYAVRKLLEARSVADRILFVNTDLVGTY
jgi:hypothetical protein